MKYGSDGSIWHEFIDFDNFIEAERRASLGKKDKRQVINFRKDYDVNLMELYHNTIEGRFHTSPYREKTIYEPKERKIYILPYNPDRIVQHAVFKPLQPYFTRMFIEQTYACVPGRGQKKASYYARKAIQNNTYCLKCDIHHFYPSVNQQILSDMIHDKFDCGPLMDILDDIIFSFPGGTNLPIGNYSSQWLGNFYLTPLDNYIKRVLKFHWYERYCDDFILYSNNKDELTEAKKKIEEFLFETLKLTYSFAEVFKLTDTQGVDFVGYRHFRDHVLVRKSTAQREMRMLKKKQYQYVHGIITRDQFRATLDSYLGIYKFADSFNLQRYTKIKQLRLFNFGLQRRFKHVAYLHVTKSWVTIPV